LWFQKRERFQYLYLRGIYVLFYHKRVERLSLLGRGFDWGPLKKGGARVNVFGSPLHRVVTPDSG